MRLQAGTKIEDFLQTLPEGIISGDAVQLTDGSIRSMLSLAGAGPNDAVIHLGCGTGRAVEIALQEFGVSSAVGVDSDPEKIKQAEARAPANAAYLCGQAQDADLSDATVAMFWFADERAVDAVMARASSLAPGCRIVTVWSPLPGCMPDGVDFPYILHRAPFRQASSLSEQVRAVFGVRCIDFVTAWEHAERYTRALEPEGAQNNRLVTIMQALLIWINARNAGVSCTKEPPEPIRAYMGILRSFYNIEVGHLLGK